MDEVAAEHGKSRSQVALNWVLRKDNVVTIPKAGDKQHVKENSESVGWKLSDKDIERLNSAFPA